jgi:transposase InsO family protein
MQDYFTKWPVAVAIPDKHSQTVADVLLEHWVTVFGCPLKMHSDLGGESSSDLYRDLCSLLRIDKTFTTAYMPRSNGLVERSNRTIQALLKCVVNDDRSDWDTHLQAVVCAYRATPHASTGVSPFKMLFGREMTMPVDLQFDTGNRPTEHKCPTAYTEWVKCSLQNAHDKARKLLKQAAARQKKGYKEDTRSVQFVRGDWVWRSYPKLRPGKLHKQNTGPWLVLCKTSPVNYRIHRNKDTQPTIVHVDRIARYYPSAALPTWLPTLTGECVDNATHTSSETIELRPVDTIGHDCVPVDDTP